MRSRSTSQARRLPGPRAAAVLVAAAVGLALLGVDANRPEILLPLSLVLAGVGLRTAASFGSGVALAASLAAGLPFLVWAGHHYDADLERASLASQLRRRDTTELHLDVAVRGVGTGSCGPDTRPEYRVRPGTYRWRWWLVVDTSDTTSPASRP